MSFPMQPIAFLHKFCRVLIQFLTRTVQCFISRLEYTIQYRKRSLLIPLPYIPGSLLCSVTSLLHYLLLNSGPSHSPLFSVVCPTSPQLFPVTYHHFCFFIYKVISATGLVPGSYSPHRFRRSGASIAFRCNVPGERIQRQGDWQSDAYLIQLEMSSAQKRLVVHSMAATILQLSSR